MDNFLAEFANGSMDGIITTFSIIAGAIGGDLSRNVILILGLSNVLSDGYSFGAARYIGSKIEIEQGLLSGKTALQSSIAIFLSFVAVGILPLIPFIINGESSEGMKKAIKASFVIALILFIVIGLIKGYTMNQPLFKNALETFYVGSSAALIAFIIGKTLNHKKN